MTQFEQHFQEVFGLDRFQELVNFIQLHDLLSQYQKVRNSPEELCRFGFQYGLIEIVAFCYCCLKISLDISDVINGHFKIVNSTIPEFTENEFGRMITGFQESVLHRPSANDGLVMTTLDKFTEGRQKCLNYLLKMKKFSKFVIQKAGSRYSYQYRIVDKYISAYNLLNVH